MKTHKAAVVVFPPEPAWGPIQAIRREHDRHLRRWMPHVTLLYPFRPAAQFEAVLPALRQAVQPLAPFDVTLRTIRSFEHGRGRYTLWLAPEPASGLDELQAALQTAVPDCDDVRRYANGFTPHLSIGQVQGRAAYAALKETLHHAWQPLTFRVDRIHLIRLREPPADVFEVVHTVQWGGAG
jgi:2'-5' RNA ligase